MFSLIELKKIIEDLNHTRQLELLKIFLKHNTSISENKNGIFINLSYINNECLEEINKYVIYIKEQDENLQEMENMKAIFIKEHFDLNIMKNQNKENTSYSNNYE